MVRISKQSERRAKSPRKRHYKPASKDCTSCTVTNKNTFKEHPNALTGNIAAQAYIPKIK